MRTQSGLLAIAFLGATSSVPILLTKIATSDPTGQQPLRAPSISYDGDHWRITGIDQSTPPLPAFDELFATTSGYAGFVFEDEHSAQQTFILNESGSPVAILGSFPIFEISPDTFAVGGGDEGPLSVISFGDREPPRIPIEIDSIGKSLCGSVFAARRGDSWGILSSGGVFRVVANADNIGTFTDETAVAKRGDRFGYVSKSGDWLIEPKYKGAKGFVGGVAFIWNQDGEGQLIDRKGHALIRGLRNASQPSRARNVFPVQVNETKLWDLVLPSGKPITNRGYRYISDFIDGQAWFQRDSRPDEGAEPDRIIGLIDETGQEIMTFERARRVYRIFHEQAVVQWNNGFYTTELISD